MTETHKPYDFMLGKALKDVYLNPVSIVQFYAMDTDLASRTKRHSPAPVEFIA